MYKILSLTEAVTRRSSVKKMHLKYKKDIGYINVWNEGMNELFFMSQSILTCLLEIKVIVRIVSLHEMET